VAVGVAIQVNLRARGKVNVRILNPAGRIICIFLGRDMNRGQNTLHWNGLSDRGTKVPPGKYLVEVSAMAPSGTASKVVTGLQMTR